MFAHFRRWRYGVLALAIVVSVAAVGVQILSAGGNSGVQPARPTVLSLPNAGRPEVGHPAPQFVLPTTATGRPLALASLTGGIVVLNFFYSTCPPCLKERDQIAQVAQQFAGRVTVLGIDPVDTPADAQAFLSPGGGSVVGLLDADWHAASAYDILGFPTTFVIKADGTISAKQTGALTAAELVTLIHDAS